MDEEDRTYEKLRRIPYDEVTRRIDDFAPGQYYTQNQKIDYFFSWNKTNHGWTYRDYIIELNKRFWEDDIG